MLRFSGFLFLLVVPSGVAQSLPDLQAAYLARGCGASFHWNMSTFQSDTRSGGGHGWALPDTTVNTFAPTVNAATLAVNINSWMETVSLAGCKYVLLTVKHIDGFKLWPSAYHTGASAVYGISATSWYASNGNPDLVALFADSARAHGLGVGFYYAIKDRTLEHRSSNCGNQNVNVVSTGGKSANCYSEYMSMISTELTELLTSYGPVMAILTDGWGYWDGYTSIDYSTIYSLIKTLQPGCLLIENSHAGNADHTDIVLYEVSYAGESTFPANNAVPSETWEPARYASYFSSFSTVPEQYWFYNQGESLLYSASFVFSPRYMYLRGRYYNARSSNYMANLEPDRSGVIPPAQSLAFRLWKSEVTKPTNLAAGKAVTSSSTYPTTGAGAVLTDGILVNAFGNISTLMHTATNDTTPYMEIDLGAARTVGAIELFNRSDVGDVHPGRLRDLTVTLYDAGHSQLITVAGINTGNLGYGSYVGDGSYSNGPGQLTIVVPYTSARYVRVSRTPDSSATGDDKNCLVLAEMQVFGRFQVSPWRRQKRR